MRAPRSRRQWAAAAALVALTTLLAACTATTSGSGSLAAGTSPGAGGSTSSGGSSATPAAPTQPRASFSDCSNRFRLSALNLPSSTLSKLRFDCAAISVPLDYAQPSGRSITLALVRVHDTDNTSPTGSLLVNPGGPGGSGVELALGLTKQLVPTLLQHFDVIGFDPRGIGSSTPINCLSDAQKDRFNAASPDVLTKHGFAQAEQAAANFSRACLARYDATALAQFNTVQTARDMDQIRQAVGDSSMNYLGFSYGTELGAQYAHLFPSRIRVAVLDGAVDPLSGPIKSAGDQLQGFEDAFDQFASWCTKHSPCSQLSNPRRSVYSLVSTARRSPIPTSASGDSRQATSSIVLTGVLSALYSKAQWRSLGDALLAARDGDSKGLFTLADQYNERFDGHYSNIAEANTTVNCNDSPPGPSNATIRATAKTWARKYPMFGRYSAPSLFSCQQWQPTRTVPAKPTATSAAHKILVIGNIHDPATPYQGAKDLTATLGDAQLLTWDGEGHTSYLQGSSCVDQDVNTYLIKGTLPAKGAVCQR